MRRCGTSRTWFSRHGGTGLIVGLDDLLIIGLDDLRGLFQSS